MPAIKALAFDVDGVLTDGGVWWGPDGQEWKRFSFADIMGLSLARQSGFLLALVSGEDSPLVDRLAAKFGITEVHKGCKDKAAAVRLIAERNALRLDEICFMGDDVNDLPALSMVGLAAAPADAQPAVRRACRIVTQLPGGKGAVRELVDGLLLQASIPGGEPRR